MHTAEREEDGLNAAAAFPAAAIRERLAATGVHRGIKLRIQYDDLRHEEKQTLIIVKTKSQVKFSVPCAIIHMRPFEIPNKRALKIRLFFGGRTAIIPRHNDKNNFKYT